MRLMQRHRVGGFLVILLMALSASAQGGGAAAHLFARYEHGAATHRISESILTLALSVNSEARARVAIRVCSREPMPFAMATAGADPFLVADRLVNAHAYTPGSVLFLRSEDCLSAERQFEPVTEVWAVPDGAPLPPHIEAFRSDQITRVALGERPDNRGVRDYRGALRTLIRNLRADPESVGVVFGYFLERPSPVLLRRLHEVERILVRSRLPRDHYLVRTTAWNDEASTVPPDAEPKYPSIFLIRVVSGAKSDAEGASHELSHPRRKASNLDKR